MYTMNQDHDHRLHRLRCRSSLHQNRTLSARCQLRPKNRGRTPTATGRAEQTGTGLFFWEAGGVHADTDQRLYVMVQDSAHEGI
jgi:hypothetical protein